MIQPNIPSALEWLHSVGKMLNVSVLGTVPFFQALLGLPLKGQKVSAGNRIPSSWYSVDRAIVISSFRNLLNDGRPNRRMKGIRRRRREKRVIETANLPMAVTSVLLQLGLGIHRLFRPY